MHLDDLVLDENLDWSHLIPDKFHRPGFYLLSGSMYGGKTTAALLELENRTRPILMHLKRQGLEADINDIAIGVQSRANKRDIEKSDRIESRSLKSALRYEILEPDQAERLLAEPFASKPVWYIEEIQFFGPPIVQAVDLAVEQGRMIFATGLNRDFAGRVFGEMGSLLALAEPRADLYAACGVCGEEASRSQRFEKKNGVLVPAHIDSPIVQTEGDQVPYEPRCIKHHEVPGRYERLKSDLIQAIEHRYDSGS